MAKKKSVSKFSFRGLFSCFFLCTLPVPRSFLSNCAVLCRGTENTVEESERDSGRVRD